MQTTVLTLYIIYLAVFHLTRVIFYTSVCNVCHSNAEQRSQFYCQFGLSQKGTYITSYTSCKETVPVNLEKDKSRYSCQQHQKQRTCDHCARFGHSTSQTFISVIIATMFATASRFEMFKHAEIILLPQARINKASRTQC